VPSSTKFRVQASGRLSLHYHKVVPFWQVQPASLQPVSLHPMMGCKPACLPWAHDCHSFTTRRRANLQIPTCQNVSLHPQMRQESCLRQHDQLVSRLTKEPYLSRHHEVIKSAKHVCSTPAGSQTYSSSHTCSTPDDVHARVSTCRMQSSNAQSAVRNSTRPISNAEQG